jgi:hypothetical protein
MRALRGKAGKVGRQGMGGQRHIAANGTLLMKAWCTAAAGEGAPAPGTCLTAVFAAKRARSFFEALTSQNEQKAAEQRANHSPESGRQHGVRGGAGSSSGGSPAVGRAGS